MLNSALILKLISMYLLYNHKGEERGFVVSKSLGLNIWETNYVHVGILRSGTQ